MPLYNNNGKVDGFEFILSFYHLRFEQRSVDLTARVAAERRVKSAAISVLEERNAYYEQKNFLQLSDDVSEENFLTFF